MLRKMLTIFFLVVECVFSPGTEALFEQFPYKENHTFGLSLPLPLCLFLPAKGCKTPLPPLLELWGTTNTRSAPVVPV